MTRPLSALLLSSVLVLSLHGAVPSEAAAVSEAASVPEACEGLLTAGDEQVPATETAHFFGHVRRFDRDGIRCLKEVLGNLGKCRGIRQECPAASQIQRLLFGTVWRRDLPDVVIHLKSRGGQGLAASQPILMWNGRTTPYLFGREHIFVVVFADRKRDMVASLLTRYQQPGNPFSGLLKLINLTPPEPKSDPEGPVEEPLVWTTLNSDSAGPRLYLGWARLSVKRDSVNHLTVSFKEGPVVGDQFSSLSIHFTNTDASQAAFGVSLAATLNTEGTGFDDGTESTHLGGYALGRLYFLRPRLKVDPGKVFKRSRPSFAIAVGTNVAGGDSFDEFVAGISISHLFGKAGLFLGANRIPSSRTMVTGPDGQMVEVVFESRWRPIIGAEYSF